MNIYRIASLLAIVLLSVLMVCPAVAEDYRSVSQYYSAAWDNYVNWERWNLTQWVPADPYEYPDDCEDTVWIRDGYKIMIQSVIPGPPPFEVTVGALYVDQGGMIYFPGGNTLTLCDFDDSYVDGQIGTTCQGELDSGCMSSVLVIDGDVTINGEGGVILTGADVEHGTAALDIVAAEGGGTLVIDGVGPGSTETMAIIARYSPVEIECYLGNLGLVQSEMTPQESGAGVTLSGTSKGGMGGYYRAVLNEDMQFIGSIDVNCGMTGTCDFEVLSPYARISFNHAISCYGGDFLLEAGMLEFSEYVCTSGKFTVGKSGGTNDALVRLWKPAGFSWSYDCGCQ